MASPDCRGLEAKLNSLIGIDSRKPARTTPDIFKQALDEVKKEFSDEAKRKATEKIREAMKLVQEFARTEAEFEKVKQKFSRGIAQYLKELESMSDGSVAVEAPAVAEEQA